MRSVRGAARLNESMQAQMQGRLKSFLHIEGLARRLALYSAPGSAAYTRHEGKRTGQGVRHWYRERVEQEEIQSSLRQGLLAPSPLEQSIPQEVGHSHREWVEMQEPLFLIRRAGVSH